MAMGKRKRHANQPAMWVATQDLPRSAAHPFYARLNQILDEHDFDGFVEGLRACLNCGACDVVRHTLTNPVDFDHNIAVRETLASGSSCRTRIRAGCRQSHGVSGSPLKCRSDQASD
jgi:hypothetical protein